MHKMTGTSLIEILISLFLLSLLLFGWDTIQISALQIMQGAYHFHIAQQQLLNIAETIKSNNGIDANTINVWHQQNKQLLPHAQGKISGHYPSFNIEVKWGNNPTCEFHNPLGKSGCLQLAINL